MLNLFLSVLISLFTVTASGAYDYNYELHGLYSETGAYVSPVNVTVHTLTDSSVVLVDGFTVFGLNQTPLEFTWSLDGGGTRQIHVKSDNETVYFFAPEDAYAVYSFNIRDYVGAIGQSNSQLESVRVVNGTEQIIESVLIWNTETSIPLYLVKNKVYILQVRLPDDEVYRFGYFIPGDQTPPTLTITNLGFDDAYQPVNKWIQIVATRPNATHIQINYNDTLGQTLSVFAEIQLRNGTQIWNDTQTEDAYVFNWYGANNETEYVVKVLASHGYYSMIEYSKILAGVSPHEAPPDWSPIGGGSYILSIFIIIATGGAVSALNKAVGLFVTASVASALTALNWIAIPYEMLVLALAISVLMGLTGRG